VKIYRLLFILGYCLANFQPLVAGADEFEALEKKQAAPHKKDPFANKKLHCKDQTSHFDENYEFFTSDETRSYVWIATIGLSASGNYEVKKSTLELIQESGSAGGKTVKVEKEVRHVLKFKIVPDGVQFIKQGNDVNGKPWKTFYQCKWKT